VIIAAENATAEYPKLAGSARSTATTTHVACSRKQLEYTHSAGTGEAGNQVV
jgi:hypothetical protein